MFAKNNKLNIFIFLSFLLIIFVFTYFLFFDDDIGGFKNLSAENQAFRVCTLTYAGQKEYKDARIVMHRYFGPHSSLYSIKRFFNDYPKENIKITSRKENATIFTLEENDRNYIIKDYMPEVETNYLIIISYPITNSTQNTYDKYENIIQNLSNTNLEKIFTKYCTTENILKNQSFHQ